MSAPTCDGRVVLNVEGKQYVASFRLDGGFITVTSGSASERVEVGDVADPGSVARTVLRRMVTEGGVALALLQASQAQARASSERVAARDQLVVRPRSSMRHARIRH